LDQAAVVFQCFGAGRFIPVADEGDVVNFQLQRCTEKGHIDRKIEQAVGHHPFFQDQVVQSGFFSTDGHIDAGGAAADDD